MLITKILPLPVPITTVDPERVELAGRASTGSQSRFCPFQVTQQRSGLIPKPEGQILEDCMDVHCVALSILMMPTSVCRLELSGPKDKREEVTPI